MFGALIILGVLVLIGIILYIGELKHRRKAVEISKAEAPEEQGGTQGAETSSSTEVEEGCCGLHLVCEKDSLSPMSGEIEYFDDEELDRFIGRSGMDYTPEETEEFRDVLMTLRPEDVSGWARSITARRLELPSEIRDELLLLVNEQRSK
ncbi:MAG: phospholipase [Muribaculaceae bacterium]|nr:phospholipase [Muribaculaceae bacterium]